MATASGTVQHAVEMLHKTRARALPLMSSAMGTDPVTKYAPATSAVCAMLDAVSKLQQVVIPITSPTPGKQHCVVFNVSSDRPILRWYLSQEDYEKDFSEITEVKTFPSVTVPGLHLPAYLQDINSRLDGDKQATVVIVDGENTVRFDPSATRLWEPTMDALRLRAFLSSLVGDGPTKFDPEQAPYSTMIEGVLRGTFTWLQINYSDTATFAGAPWPTKANGIQSAKAIFSSPVLTSDYHYLHAAPLADAQLPGNTITEYAVHGAPFFSMMLEHEDAFVVLDPPSFASQDGGPVDTPYLQLLASDTERARESPAVHMANSDSTYWLRAAAECGTLGKIREELRAQFGDEV